MKGMPYSRLGIQYSTHSLARASVKFLENLIEYHCCTFCEICSWDFVIEIQVRLGLIAYDHVE